MNTKSLVLNKTNVKEIESLIKKLPNKTSCGHDSISNVMLKHPSDSISFPLMIIFNQSIAQGHFPDSMKKAEIIPLFKGKECDQVINYQPISLLITISKVLEKSYIRDCINSSTNMTYCIKANMASGTNIPANKQYLS